ncbi:ATP-binding protein [Chitinimonas naiadis]
MSIANTDWFWETDRALYLTNTNQSLAAWLGKSQASLAGMAMREAVPEALWHQCRQAYVTLSSEKDALSFDYEHFDEHRQVSCRRRVCGRYAFGDTQRLVWYAYDINPYYEMLHDLQAILYEVESEREAMHEHAMVARLSKQGRFVYVSEMFARLSGQNARKLIGQGYEALDARFEDVIDSEALLAQLQDGQSWRGEMQVRRPDGGYCYWQASIVALRGREGHIEFFHISHDLTSSRESQRQLAAENEALEQAVAARTRELETSNAELAADIRAREAMTAERDRLVSIVENTTDIIGISEYDGRVLYMNAAARRFYNIPADEDVGQTLTPDYLPSHASRHLMGTAIPAAMERGSWSGESTLYDAVGTEIPVSLVVLAEQDGKGRVKHFSSIARDIHETKQKEQQLKAQNEALEKLNGELESVQHQLIQSEKMASIGQLAAGVAHEINNPIGYVNSNIGTLGSYVDELLGLLDAYASHVRQDPALAISPALDEALQRADIEFLREDIKQLLSESHEGIGRVKKIVQDLKDFSRVDTAEEWEFADLHHCLDSTLNIVRNEIKYKAEVVHEYGQLPAVQCLPSQLNQVFLNLMVNAAHAIEARGTITIATGLDGDRVWIRISDTGCGMSPDVIRRIFEPFYTTKPVGKGTGLGLSLSYSIVKKHHGDIRVESTPGKGTRFEVILPVNQNIAVAA